MVPPNLIVGILLHVIKKGNLKELSFCWHCDHGKHAASKLACKVKSVIYEHMKMLKVQKTPQMRHTTTSGMIRV
jgi:hypothetical protein